MEVFFYKLPVCPRCLAAERHVRRILADSPHEIHTMDILKNRQRAREEGISMAPAIRVNRRVLSGLWLSEMKIRKFLEESFEMDQG
ncbi:hypothetical protein LZ24_02205 [Desulfobotulus alkaliphilus]|uniref:Thioredoxin-like protein n=1 Tax=Desulfobotulus alkaliphilus TaxID=622671 RepID=A0A562RQE2_9BACT|nr:hypothetical protein [Desulfobotulus alkaliphilus]TWI70784.1 hypothetical protein LZ24_02205 [Desulfobotulus alkaliphilus]